LLFELSVLEFWRDDQVLCSGIIDHLLLLFGSNSLDLLNMRFGPLRCHLLVGMTFLAPSTNLLHVVLERPFSLLLGSLSRFLSLVNFGCEFSCLLNFLVDHFWSELISCLEFWLNLFSLSLDNQVSGFLSLVESLRGSLGFLKDWVDDFLS
jgi:hypothetical protein